MGKKDIKSAVQPSTEEPHTIIQGAPRKLVCIIYCCSVSHWCYGRGGCTRYWGGVGGYDTPLFLLPRVRHSGVCPRVTVISTDESSPVGVYIEVSTRANG